MVHNFSCDECDKTFVTAAHLVKHLEVDHKSAVYKCNQCCYETKDGNLLIHHLKKAHVHLCDQCSKAFIRKTQFDLHIKVDHEGMETDTVIVDQRSKTYLCTHCNIEFKSKILLEKHKRKIVVRYY